MNLIYIFFLNTRHNYQNYNYTESLFPPFSLFLIHHYLSPQSKLSSQLIHPNKAPVISSDQLINATA